MLTGSLTDTERLWQQRFWSQLQSLEPGQGLSTEFLDPVQLRLAEAVLGQATHLSYTAYGGYPAAQRVCLYIFPSDQSGKLPLVSGVKVTGGLDSAGLNSAELWGEIMRIGFMREQLGDVITLSENELAVMTLSTVAPIICRRLTGVGGYPVQCQEINPSQLNIPSRSSKQISGTVASLRLDSILSLGFKLSRSRAALLIKGGLVKVNWRPATSPATRIGEGDQIILSGRGELKVLSLTGKTRKGRQGLILAKYS